MAQSDTTSNSDGRAISAERMGEIVNGLTGITLILSSASGNLSLSIQNANENYGCLQEILSMILQLQKDGNISVKLTSS